jgi:hypothetical protein
MQYETSGVKLETLLQKNVEALNLNACNFWEKS